MKKIYLLMMGLVAFAGTVLAQMPCPTAPRAIRDAENFPPPPHCYVTVSFLNHQANWYIKLKSTTGAYIPVLNTGPGTGNPAVNYVAVDETTGSATYYYDCTVGTPALFEYVYFDPISAPATCTFNNIEAPGSLPVKLTSFTGRLQNDNEVALDWTSAMELESARYEVERSVDGKNFAKVGTLKAAGNTLDVSRYKFTDNLPSAGAYYYRLKQIDLDMTFEYSKVVYVNSKKGSGVVTKIFPNPFKGEVQLIGATSSDLTPKNVQVFSISGQRITYRFMGANSILIDPSAPEGVYILQVKEQRFKLVKNPSGTSY